MRGTTAPTGQPSPSERAAWYPPDWPEISAAIKRRDGYRCQIGRLRPEQRCVAYFPPPFHHRLHVHHLVALPAGSNSPKNLLTLCTDCHGLIHGRAMGKPISERTKQAARRW